MQSPGLVFLLFLLVSLCVTILIITLAHSKITLLQRVCVNDNVTLDTTDPSPHHLSNNIFISSPTPQIIQSSTITTTSSSFFQTMRQKNFPSAKQSYCLQRLNSYLPCSHILVLSPTLVAVFCPLNEKYLESISIYQESTSYGLRFQPLVLFKGAEIRAFYDVIVACSTKKLNVCDNDIIQTQGSTSTPECDGYHLKSVNDFIFASFCFSKQHLKLTTIYLHKKYIFSVFEINDLLNNLKLYRF